MNLIIDPKWKEHFQERAAIIEYDAKIPRKEAEQLALNEINKTILKDKIKKLEEKQSKKPLHIHIHKKVDTAILATGEI